MFIKKGNGRDHYSFINVTGHKCVWGHTGLNPGKTGARMFGFQPLCRGKECRQGVLTVSHGALDDLFVMTHFGWNGFAQMCDVDDGSCVTGEWVAPKYPSNFSVRRPLYMDLLSSIVMAIKDSWIHETAVIDADFTHKIKDGFKVIQPMLDLLNRVKWKGRFLLTFCDHRDSFRGDSGKRATPQRLNWLQANLPDGWVITRHDCYQSSRVERSGEKDNGSPMCVVELRRAPVVRQHAGKKAA